MLREAAVELMPGTIVDRYRVEARLGSGGMATVYRVRHTTLDTCHALKVLRWTNEEGVQRLIREGRLQGAVSHENVLGVSDCVRIDGAPGLVLEYISGWTLAELLAVGPLSRAQADWLARGILEGVAAAHAHGLVHRDLKPANILLAWEGGVPVPKIADFGLARAVDAATLAGRLTCGSLGTPGYMAPEQVIDAAGADHRADVFSVGAVLYELLAGRRAFEGENVYAVLEAVRRGEPPAMGAVPEAWREAIEGALQPDPQRRIPTVAALLERWSGHRESVPLDWPVPPEVGDALWEASLVDRGASTHPDLDLLLDEPERADVVAHLAACAACRLDRRLYRETFGPPVEAHPSTWKVALAAGLVAVPVSIGVLTALFGELRSVDDGGVWGPVLLLAGVVEAVALAVIVARQSAGREHPIWLWSLPSVFPVAVGSAGAVLGLRMMSRVLDRPEAPELFARGLPMALRVDWAGWILATAGLLFSAGAWAWHLRHEREGLRRTPLVWAALGGLLLWAGSVWVGTDGLGTFVTWAVLLLVGGMVGLYPAGARGWPVAVFGLAAVACASRALHVGHLQGAPLSDLGLDGWICAGFVGVAAGVCLPSLRGTARQWFHLGVLVLPVAGALWVSWAVSGARALLP